MKNVAILTEKDYPAWDEFVADHPLGNIHQLGDWGKFQMTRGPQWAFFIIALKVDDRIVGGTLLLRRHLYKNLCWFYSAKGPLIDYNSDTERDEYMQLLLDQIAELAKREKAVYLRVEAPTLKDGPHDFPGHLVDGVENWGKHGFRKAHAHYQPEHTLVLDLRSSKEDILAQMKSKGRYNIRLAQKKDLIMELGGVDLPLTAAVKEFHGLLEETFVRDGFGGHSQEYYLNMLEILGSEKAKLYLAKHSGEYIAGILVTFYKDLAIYYFGASSSAHRNLMAPYFLQWQAIQDAKSVGMKWYDFLGTAPLNAGEKGFEYDEKHSWAGVTEFKLKFGGHKIDFEPGVELVYKPFWYYLMLLRKFLSSLFHK